jgi:hypothetical protein
MMASATKNLAQGKGQLSENKETHGNSTSSEKPSGNYEHKTESGKTYNGVGGEKRMEQSAKNIEKKYGDKVVSSEHTPAANKREALIKEHNAIEKNGGAGNKDRNYNQINSPGKKLLEQ